jgi:hypothetical protein
MSTARCLKSLWRVPLGPLTVTILDFTVTVTTNKEETGIKHEFQRTWNDKKLTGRKNESSFRPPARSKRQVVPPVGISTFLVV